MTTVDKRLVLERLNVKVKDNKSLPVGKQRAPLSATLPASAESTSFPPVMVKSPTSPTQLSGGALSPTSAGTTGSRLDSMKSGYRDRLQSKVDSVRAFNMSRATTEGSQSFPSTNIFPPLSVPSSLNSSANGGLNARGLPGFPYNGSQSVPGSAASSNDFLPQPDHGAAGKPVYISEFPVVDLLTPAGKLRSFFNSMRNENFKSHEQTIQQRYQSLMEKGARERGVERKRSGTAPPGMATFQPLQYQMAGGQKSAPVVAPGSPSRRSFESTMGPPGTLPAAGRRSFESALAPSPGGSLRGSLGAKAGAAAALQAAAPLQPTPPPSKYSATGQFTRPTKPAALPSDSLNSSGNSSTRIGQTSSVAASPTSGSPLGSAGPSPNSSFNASHRRSSSAPGTLRPDGRLSTGGAAAEPAPAQIEPSPPTVPFTEPRIGPAKPPSRTPSLIKKRPSFQASAQAAQSAAQPAPSSPPAESPPAKAVKKASTKPKAAPVPAPAPTAVDPPAPAAKATTAKPAKNPKPTKAAKSTEAPPPLATPLPAAAFPTAPANTTPCSFCARNFASERIAKHEAICEKTFGKERKVFDETKMRVAGTELAEYQGRGASAETTKAPTKKKMDWRKEHEQFQAAIKSAKEVTAHLASGGKASDLPPPPPAENTGIPCTHCGRKFASGSIEKHEKICMNVVHKPKGVVGGKGKAK